MKSVDKLFVDDHFDPLDSHLPPLDELLEIPLQKEKKKESLKVRVMNLISYTKLYNILLCLGNKSTAHKPTKPKKDKQKGTIIKVLAHGGTMHPSVRPEIKLHHCIYHPSSQLKSPEAVPCEGGECTFTFFTGH